MMVYLHLHHHQMLLHHLLHLNYLKNSFFINLKNHVCILFLIYELFDNPQIINESFHIGFETPELIHIYIWDLVFHVFLIPN